MEHLVSSTPEIRPVTLDEVKHAFQKARSMKSSYAPAFISFFQPKRFQCLTTALAVKKTFGGNLAVCRIAITNKLKEILLEASFGRKKFLHFANAIDNGIVDITGDQIHTEKYLEIGPLRDLNEDNIDILHGVCDNLNEKTQILQNKFEKYLAEILEIPVEKLHARIESGVPLELVSQ